MEITLKTFIIICPFLFLAGLIDAIGGGGGLISLPAYLIADFHHIQQLQRTRCPLHLGLHLLLCDLLKINW